MKLCSRCVLFVFCVLALAPRYVLAQYRQVTPYELMRGRQLQISSVALSAGVTRHSIGRLAAGGLIGGLLGAVVGAAAGAAIASDQDEDAQAGEPWVDAAWGAAVGGAAGESIGLGTGVWLSNGKQGNLLIDIVASLVIGGIGFAVLSNNQDPPVAPIVLVVTPLLQLGATIALERKTAKW